MYRSSLCKKKAWAGVPILGEKTCLARLPKALKAFEWELKGLCYKRVQGSTKPQVPHPMFLDRACPEEPNKMLM